MASFSDQGFDTNAFSVNAFDFGSPTPPTPVVPTVPSFPIGGGYPAQDQRTRKEVSEARKRLGLEDELSVVEARAKAVIDLVAKRQAEALELDKQKQFDELSRELRLKGVELESVHLETLNLERERLISLEISTRLKLRLREEEELMMLVLMAAITEA